MTTCTDVPLRAHLLVQADPGSAEGVRTHLLCIPGVVQASTTHGAFDAVAHVSVDSETELRRVLAAARRAPGLARLCLCRPARTEIPAV